MEQQQQRSILKQSSVPTAAAAAGLFNAGSPAPAAGDKPKPSSRSLDKPAVASVPTTTQNQPSLRVDLKYHNHLPSIPFDPKFLDLPFMESDFLWGYNAEHGGGSTLERNYKYRIHMNPPALLDDMIDPLGNEEWARSTEFDERDRNLLRKEGQAPSSNKSRNWQSVSKRSWMLKTYYTQENTYQPNNSASTLQNSQTKPGDGDDDDDGHEDEEVFNQANKITRQFQRAEQMQRTSVVPGAQKQVKRVISLLPHRSLRDLDMHICRFKLGEKTGIPTTTDEAAVLVRRREKPQLAFSPLALFVGNANKDEEEDDLFADEDEDNEQKQEVHHLRDYQVETTTQKSRFVLYIDATQTARFVELHDEALKLFRLPDHLLPHRRRRKDADDDEDEGNPEAHVKLHFRKHLTDEEQEDRKRRRLDVEGEDEN